MTITTNATSKVAAVATGFAMAVSILGAAPLAHEDVVQDHVAGNKMNKPQRLLNDLNHHLFENDRTLADECALILLKKSGLSASLREFALMCYAEMLMQENGVTQEGTPSEGDQAV